MAVTFAPTLSFLRKVLLVIFIIPKKLTIRAKDSQSVNHVYQKSNFLNDDLPDCLHYAGPGKGNLRGRFFYGK